jgi:hypothetical protein
MSGRTVAATLENLSTMLTGDETGWRVLHQLGFYDLLLLTR